MNTFAKELMKKVSAQCHILYGDKAALAKLRRGIGKKMGERPEILAYVLLDIEKINVEHKKEGEPTKVEQAIYTALTLYALHQQGQRDMMHADKKDVLTNRCISFGAAVKKLVDDNNIKAIHRRFEQVMTAAGLEELAVHARGLINMLNKNGIALNYGKFAYDLYRFQDTNKRKDVMMDWGRDFYINSGKDD